MRTSTFGALALAIVAIALQEPGAAASASSAVKPGDDALSCEQIHAQGMAEAQHDRQERSRRSDETRAQQTATMGLGTMSMLSGGMGGTAQAAQMATEAGADRAVAMLATSPQGNPRLQRLKELSAQKHCTDGSAPGTGAAPIDDAMGCEQIAAELSRSAQRVQPDVQALAQSEQQLYEQERAMGEKRKVESQAVGLMWAGTLLDPTGISKRAAQAATMAQHAKDRSESESFANSPQFRQADARADRLATQAAHLQADARLQHLLQLGHQKGCDKNGNAGPR